MPIEDGDYNRLTAADIRSALEAELRNEFGQDIDLTQSSVFSTLAESLANVLADNQEQSLQDVYRSAFIDTASGEDLDRVVSIIGIQRRDAIHSTGVQQFSASSPVTNDYVVQRGTTLQTESDEPTEFETTQRGIIELFASFESGSLADYSGDTGNASIVTDASAPQGDNVLEMDATSGTHIYRDDVDMQRGSTNHAHVKPTTGSIHGITFFVDANNPGNRYQIIVDEPNGEVSLERVEDGTVTSTIDSATGLAFDNEYHEIEFRPSITGNISVTVYDGSDAEVASLGGADSTFMRGAIGFYSGDATTAKRYDFYTQSKISLNLRAINGGISGNVGANSITVMPSPPTGVESTTNLYPVGDPDYEDTLESNFVVGQNAETDSQLRERAEDAVTGGGAATHDAIVSALINEVESVNSVTMFENKTDTDNTGTGGLPPYSFEAVVFGGDDGEIAETIFEKKAVTSRDYAGSKGSAVSQTVVADSNGQEFTINFSRPTEVMIDMSLDIVVGDTYIGDDEIRDRITQYIGGTLADNTEVVGLDVGEDVIIDQIQDIVVGEDDTGVIALDQSVDGSPIETTPATTTVDGINVIDIGSNEVATSDSTDASITINKREV